MKAYKPISNDIREMIMTHLSVGEMTTIYLKDPMERMTFLGFRDSAEFIGRLNDSTDICTRQTAVVVNDIVLVGILAKVMDHHYECWMDFRDRRTRESLDDLIIQPAWGFVFCGSPNAEWSSSSRNKRSKTLRAAREYLKPFPPTWTRAEWEAAVAAVRPPEYSKEEFWNSLSPTVSQLA